MPRRSAKTVLGRDGITFSHHSMFTCSAMSHLCEEGKQLLTHSFSLPSKGSGSEDSPHGRLMRLLTDHYSQSGHVEGLTAEPVINKVEG